MKNIRFKNEIQHDRILKRFKCNNAEGEIVK